MPCHALSKDKSILGKLIPVVILGLVFASPMIAKASGVKLPGSDPSENMEAAGTVIRFFNTALFVWIGRLLAGICVIGAAWNIKEMRILPAALCVVAAAIIGTAPAWVKGAFSMMDTGDIFDRTEAPSLIHHYYAQDQNNGSTEVHYG